MKTHTRLETVEREGVTAESGFTIKATSKAFDILSSGLYSDKVGAIVRELSCNAHDSHVAAGKKDLPIEVCLPTPLKPTFHVKDFGLGLSHEDVMVLYTTYFESTKTSSDDFIGQLGLGSKSPFSYASTFLVESRFNGTKSTYSCFKNEQSFPAIARLNEEPTDEPNGLTVTLAVRPSDVDKFVQAAKKALMYFDPQPTVIGPSGFKPFSLKHTVTGTNWKLRDTEYYAHMSGAHVIQGFVAYPVDVHQLEENGLSPAASGIANTDIDMFVEIGKVEVAASREALSYDKRTITNLIAAFEAAAREMRTSFQAEFDKCKTSWEVAMLLDKMENGGTAKFRQVFKEMNRAQPFQWNGADVTTTCKLDLSKVKDTQIQRLAVKRARRSNKLHISGQWHPVNSTSKTFEFDCVGNTLVMIDTEAKGANQAIADWMAGRPEVGGRAVSIILIRPVSKPQYNQKEIDSIVKMLGSPATQPLTIIPQAAKVRKTYSSGQKRAMDERMVFTGFQPDRDYQGRSRGVRRTFSRLTWTTEQIDLNAGGFYVELERFTPVDVNKTGASVDHLDDIIKHAVTLGILPDDVRVIGMNEKELKSIKGNKEWVELFKAVKTGFKKANKDNALYSKLICDAVMHNVGAGVLNYLVKPWAKLEAKIRPGHFKTAVQTLVDLYLAAGAAHPESVQKLEALLRLERDDTLNERIEQMPNDWKASLKAYEMLPLVSMSEYSDAWVQPVINYVNMVDG